MLELLVGDAIKNNGASGTDVAMLNRLPTGISSFSEENQQKRFLLFIIHYHLENLISARHSDF